MSIDFSQLDKANKDILVDTTAKVQNTRGAKKKAPEQKRTEKISIYMTTEQKEIITKKAYGNYQSISNYLLGQALNG